MKDLLDIEINTCDNKVDDTTQKLHFYVIGEFVLVWVSYDDLLSPIETQWVENMRKITVLF